MTGPLKPLTADFRHRHSVFGKYPLGLFLDNSMFACLLETLVGNKTVLCDGPWPCFMCMHRPKVLNDKGQTCIFEIPLLELVISIIATLPKMSDFF